MRALGYKHVLVVCWVRIVGTFYIRGCKGRNNVSSRLLMSVVLRQKFVGQSFPKIKRGPLFQNLKIVAKAS